MESPAPCAVLECRDPVPLDVSGSGQAAAQPVDRDAGQPAGDGRAGLSCARRHHLVPAAEIAGRQVPRIGARMTPKPADGHQRPQVPWRYRKADAQTWRAVGPTPMAQSSSGDRQRHLGHQSRAVIPWQRRRQRRSARRARPDPAKCDARHGNGRRDLRHSPPPCAHCRLTGYCTHHIRKNSLPSKADCPAAIASDKTSAQYDTIAERSERV